MEFRRLGHSGLMAPSLSLGTATFGGGNPFFKAWGTTGVEEARRLVGCSERPCSHLSVLASGATFGRSKSYAQTLFRPITGKDINSGGVSVGTS